MMAAPQEGPVMDVVCRAVRGVRLGTIQPEDDVKTLLNRLWQDEKGQDLVEYALLLVLIALAAAATIQTLGTSIVNVFSNANAAVTGYTT
jgi:pilus assembly protein Flp/PilA